MPSSNTINVGQTISDALFQLQCAQQSLDSIDLSLVNEIQYLLQEKASLQADIEALREEKDDLCHQVKCMKKNGAREAIDDGGKDLPPSHFLCPMTLEVTKVPMEHKETKHNYERKAIFEWIYFGKATCPLTRKKLHPDDFVENVRLRKEIEFWKSKHGVGHEDSEDELDDSGIFIPDLSLEEEKAQQTRLSISKHGSHKELMGIRDRVLNQREKRVKRRMSQGMI